MTRRRNRNQRGYVYESGSTIYIRYYTGGRLETERLCEKDVTHFVQVKKVKGRKNLKTYPSPAVQLKAQEFMLTVNSRNGQATADPQITSFYEHTYLPWLTESGKRASTIRGYTYIWKLYLKDHVSDLRLREYQTHHGSLFLTGLAKTLSRTSIAHIRSLASGIFSHAVNLGLLKTNPWREVKVLARMREPEPTDWYTVEEIQAVLEALASKPAYRLMMALAFYAGLRTEEIAGLQFGDIEEDWLHVRRTVVRGVVGPCKTKKSAAPVPLIQPLRGLLAEWRELCHKPQPSAWVFQTRKGGPHATLSNTGYNYIRPMIEKAGLVYKSLYAGRRGAATILTELTGDALAASQVLRNGLDVAMRNYLHPVPEAGIAGQKLLEARVLELTAGKNGKED